MKQYITGTYRVFRQFLFVNLVVLSFNATAQQAENNMTTVLQPKLISSQFKFTEGPAADKEGNVFFTDQPNNKIWKYSTDGKLSVFLDNAGRSNGMYFDRKGNLVTCADEKNELWSINPKGEVKVLVKDFKGARFNGPNDLWIDSKGGIYFSDPYYQRDYWERKTADPAIKGEKLYYLPAGKSEAVVAGDNFERPNGLIGSEDGRSLFVSDIGAGKIYQYDINADASLSNRRVFAEDLSDGLTLDKQGNLYLAGKGVTVYNPGGKKIRHIDIPEGWTANLCFAGKNRDTLFITASGSVYTVQMK